MKLLIQVCLLFAYTSSGSGFAADLSPSETQSISETAIRWLAFDDWSSRAPDDPYPRRKGYWLSRQREDLKKRADTPMPVKTFVGHTTVLTGIYDLTKQVLEITTPQPAVQWDPDCLYIEIAPRIGGDWKVAVKLGSTWSYIRIERGERDYCVAAYEYTMIVD